MIKIIIKELFESDFKMKKFTLLLIIICGLLSGCSRSVDTPVDPRDVIITSLTGVGNKRWVLRKLFLNNVPQTLSDSQLKYWVDFTVNPGQPYTGVFTNSDGAEGKWRLPNTQEIPFTFTNTTRIPLTYVINNITATELDVEYTANLVTSREVYNAN